MDRAELVNKLRRFINDNKYVAIVLIIGIIFMMIPNQKEKRNPPQEDKLDTVEETLSLQQVLSDTLSQYSGAGKVLVILTESESEKTVFQQDEDLTQDSERYDTVIISNSGKNQEALVQLKISPIYRGAIVLAQGAENAVVRLALTDAVSKATGLSSDRITVLKMK